jgi:hypothetical protein
MKPLLWGAALMLALSACSAGQPALHAPPATRQPAPSSTKDEGVACPADVKQCADGSFVSRTAPRCAFAACPGENKP